MVDRITKEELEGGNAMGALTKEQREYVKMKQSFDNMFKAYSDYREIVPCCELNVLSTHESNYKVEGVFYKLLENHLKNRGNSLIITKFKKVISEDYSSFLSDYTIEQMTEEFEKELNK